MDPLVRRLGHTRCEHIDAAVRLVGQLIQATPAITDVGVARAHQALDEGLSSATAVAEGERMMRALQSATNVLFLR